MECLIYSGAEQRKHQNTAPLAFVKGIHRTDEFPVKWPVKQKMFRFDDVIMDETYASYLWAPFCLNISHHGENKIWKKFWRNIANLHNSDQAFKWGILVLQKSTKTHSQITTLKDWRNYWWPRDVICKAVSFTIVSYNSDYYFCCYRCFPCHCFC